MYVTNTAKLLKKISQENFASGETIGLRNLVKLKKTRSENKILKILTLEILVELEDSFPIFIRFSKKHCVSTTIFMAACRGKILSYLKNLRNKLV